jgi:inner membrane protein
MDPLSQGVVGVTAAQTVSTKKEIATASMLGFFSGMAADLDVFIHSAEDPLLFLEYHRQFTHSIIFMPMGGLICALVFYLLFKLLSKHKSLSFGRIYLFSFVGYATHGFLDACTSYGTQLFWPFSSYRVAWNNISIIDPLFTIPLLIIINIAIFKRSKIFSYFAALFAISYLSLGLVQEHRANEHAVELAKSRGHTAIQLSVKPSFMNLIVWKSIYEYQDHYYVDAIRVSGETGFYQGGSIEKLNVKRDFPWLNSHTQQAIDIERFRWFSSDYLAVDPNNPSRIIDMRYSLLPNRLDGLWGIELTQNAKPSTHIKWTINRNSGDRQQNIKSLWSMIVGHEVLAIN